MKHREVVDRRLAACVAWHKQFGHNIDWEWRDGFLEMKTHRHGRWWVAAIAPRVLELDDEHKVLLAVEHELLGLLRTTGSGKLEHQDDYSGAAK